ncbi:MAG TPA: dihydropteroate synthase-like protein [Methanoregulaceae archaeon]|nr:dihydropteroate synthase-like protein [Methanoregulaceae archaeon]
MRILLPTGSATSSLVIEAARKFDAEVVVTGEIASFLSPDQLSKLVLKGKYDMVLVTGMSTASFEEVEKKAGVPVFLGPRHAADLPLILPLLGEVTLSRDVPADEFLAKQKEEEAMRRVEKQERIAIGEYLIRSVKIGGNSRIKVLAEIMDAHKAPDISRQVETFFSRGADIVDLGFGFDATPDDVANCFQELRDIEGPLAVDTQDPSLIAPALDRADLVLSLQEENIRVIGKQVADAGVCAVIVPGQRTLEENIRDAERAGITCIIADPLLQPVGSGLTDSLLNFGESEYPLFFGAGNVTELIDADSIGVNALMAGFAHEIGAAVIFTSEHSDKTHGSVAEMRRATEMMVLMEGRPYPKDLGIDLLVLKEKRKRREPPLVYDHVVEADEMPKDIVYDPCGNFRIGIEDGYIVAVIQNRAYRGRSWEAVFYTILKDGKISLMDHAAYLGKELFKADLALRFGRSFEQDGTF